jgi:hypothetical protein
MILELEGRSFVIDAKYKRHWEELQREMWQEQSTGWQERHREDLLQVLAYANLVSGDDIVCCLVYPCSQGTWESLAKRGRLFHHAELPNRGQRVRVWLTGVPMGALANSVAGPFGEQMRIAGHWSHFGHFDAPHSPMTSYTIAGLQLQSKRRSSEVEIRLTISGQRCEVAES